MNKAELVEKLAERGEMSNRAAKDIIDALFGIDGGIISSELKAKGKVQVTGFGTFSADHRPARDWRIPGTDKTKHVGAHYYPKFKAGKSLKDFVK
ncbi:MAG: HU family DNA-binding protein [Candidatus Eisenbacteria bacterium]|nr:HU family DNA-binding protein [Candidatus Eisenbacteria bacterium]